MVTKIIYFLDFIPPFIHFPSFITTNVKMDNTPIKIRPNIPENKRTGAGENECKMLVSSNGKIGTINNIKNMYEIHDKLNTRRVTLKM